MRVQIAERREVRNQDSKGGFLVGQNACTSSEGAALELLVGGENLLSFGGALGCGAAQAGEQTVVCGGGFQAGFCGMNQVVLFCEELGLLLLDGANAVLAAFYSGSERLACGFDRAASCRYSCCCVERVAFSEGGLGEPGEAEIDVLALAAFFELAKEHDMLPSLGT